MQYAHIKQFGTLNSTTTLYGYYKDLVRCIYLILKQSDKADTSI